jgi:hypothetical protein
MINVTVELQKYLKDNEWYDGELDGKIGPETLAGINKLLADRGLTYKWSRARKIVAAEQIIYKIKKLYPHVPDGLVGPDTQHARELYQAGLVSTWRDTAEKLGVAKPPVVKVVPIKPKAYNWPSQSGVPKYFGSPGANQVSCKLPFPLRIAWEPSQKVNSYSCHKAVKESMERVWQRTLDHYGHEKIKELRIDYFGGCLNVRRMRGGSAWSMHAWGIAIDIDPDRNPFRGSWKSAQMSKPAYKQFVQFWYDEGFINLGLEANYDGMHFQAARLK